MNKRSTEGYVLAYVLVVVVVMGLIAATLMTSTLQVVKAQENSIEYMKDKYAAQGTIEKLVAEVSACPELSGSGQLTAAQTAFSSFVNERAGKISGLKSFSAAFDDLLSEENSIYTYVLNLTAESGSVQVISKIYVNTQIKIHVTQIDPPANAPEGTEPTFEYDYTVTLLNCNFDSYEVVSSGGDT